MPRPIHFELPATDPARAARFYREALGWQATPWDGPHPYWLLATGEAGPGIDGGLAHRQEGFTAPCLVVEVADVEAAARSVVSAGGAVVRPREAVPGMGWTVYATDTEGTLFGMMQFDPQAAEEA